MSSPDIGFPDFSLTRFMGKTDHLPSFSTSPRLSGLGLSLARLPENYAPSGNVTLIELVIELNLIADLYPACHIVLSIPDGMSIVLAASAFKICTLFLPLPLLVAPRSSRAGLICATIQHHERTQQWIQREHQPKRHEKRKN